MHVWYTRSGFTLIELLIALALSGIVVGAIYSLYATQSRSYVAQDMVSEMQQNARVAMDMMSREIRMAGYDPTGTAGAGIVVAGPDYIQFTADLTDDGDVVDSKENIAYRLYDSGNDGDLDLGRISGGGRIQPVAENIENLIFVYDLTNGTTTSNPANPQHIRSLQIAITARTAEVDPGSGDYWRLTLTSEVLPRNLNLSTL